MTPKPRTTHTTEMTIYGGMTLGDLEAFVHGCTEQGWTTDATVTVRSVSPDRPGETTSTTLKVSEIR